MILINVKIQTTGFGPKVFDDDVPDDAPADDADAFPIDDVRVWNTVNGVNNLR